MFAGVLHELQFLNKSLAAVCWFRSSIPTVKGIACVQMARGDERKEKMPYEAPRETCDKNFERRSAFKALIQEMVSEQQETTKSHLSEIFTASVHVLQALYIWHALWHALLLERRSCRDLKPSCLWWRFPRLVLSLHITILSQGDFKLSHSFQDSIPLYIGDPEMEKTISNIASSPLSNHTYWKACSLVGPDCAPY